MKQNRYIGLTILLAIGLLGEARSGWGQDANSKPVGPEQTAESYGDWSVRCVKRDNLPPCDMVQVATDNKTKEQVMRFSIAHAGDREKYGIQVVVPLGVLVSAGTLVRIDDNEKNDIKDLKFTRCDTAGCYIEALVDAKVVGPLERGNTGVLAMVDGQGKPLVVPLSFRGFTSALNAMAARNREWAKTRTN